MCGIAGFVNAQRTIADARLTLQRMCGVIEHRGPDDEGFYIDDSAGLGMRRLSIIDIATGHQPISNEDDSIWLVFNGEIYNYRELRADLLARGHVFKTSSDTEVILHLYEDFGEACVERLRGMFAFAIWDKKTRALFAARDRVGIKPFHYAMAGDAFVFGSEIKSLLQHSAVTREVNFDAISDFLSFGYVPDPNTAFLGIHKLPPGHTLTLKDSRLSIRSYWDFRYDDQPAPPESEQQIEARLRDLIAESVRMRLISDVPLGAFLSGGIDSSAVVAMMQREMDRRVKTFSIGFSESSFDELNYARLAARSLNTDHHEFVVTPDVCRMIEEIVWHHDEPFADVSSIPTYIVSKMAREFVTVVLSGDGGDELFAGYDRYLVDRSRQRYEMIPRFLRRSVLGSISRALPRSAYGKNFLANISMDADARYIDSVSYFNASKKSEMVSPEFRATIAERDSSAAFKRFFATPRSASRLHHLLYLDSKTYLPGDILTKVDRMSMAHSIEARVPLLDHKLIEFVQRLPAQIKLHDDRTKHLFKQAMRGILPAEIIDRPKQGFDVPINKWLNVELREMLDDVLNDARTRQRGYFSSAAVDAIIREHRRGRRNNSRHLWGLLTLELWHRAFVDRKPEASFAGAKKVAFDRLAVTA